MSLIHCALLLVAGLGRLADAHPMAEQAAILVPQILQGAIAPPLLDSFLSYSIEFAFLPDFAGNTSSPNTFTDNLLTSLTNLQSSAPVIRVGGNTQDRTIFNPQQSLSIISTYEEAVSADWPARVEIGPAFFESYTSLPDIKFHHGFNMAISNSTNGLENVVQHAVAACNGMGDHTLAWEYGNEADCYATLRGYRPSDWDEASVFSEWLNGTQAINEALLKQCPDGRVPEWIAPSFADNGRFMSPAKAWHMGYDTQPDIQAFVQHNYIGSATDPGLTLRSSLLNHTLTTFVLANHTRLMSELDLDPSTPYILGETNSLSRQGLPLVSDTFGAALWNLDFALNAGSIGIRRVHMHQGVNYRYASWQPIETERGVRTTKPAFYGNAATADFVAHEQGEELRIVELNLTEAGQSEVEAGYAAFVDGKVQKLAVMNLRQWNATDNQQRPEQRYEFVVPQGVKQAQVKRLIADGSDAYSGVTYGGMSYNLELDEGRPVRLHNVTDVEEVTVGQDGVLAITVPDASAVVARLV